MKIPPIRIDWNRVAEVGIAAIESQEDGRPGAAKLQGAVAVVCRQLGLKAPEPKVVELVESVVQGLFDGIKGKGSAGKMAELEQAFIAQLTKAETQRAALATKLDESDDLRSALAAKLDALEDDASKVRAERDDLAAKVAKLEADDEPEQAEVEAVSATDQILVDLRKLAEPKDMTTEARVNLAARVLRMRGAEAKGAKLDADTKQNRLRNAVRAQADVAREYFHGDVPVEVEEVLREIVRLVG